ncbi:MAG: hypothetical protein SF051_03365 [Elusimicrobiota bacterium]|nr:hypothetical protein [Elusimicrobiota bacterium]
MSGARADKTFAGFWKNLFALIGLVSTVFYRSGLRAGRPNPALFKFSALALLMSVLCYIGWRNDPRSGPPPEP